MANDADVIVVGAGLGGPRGGHRNGRRGQTRDRGRSGRRAKSRRPGLLVARRTVSGRHARAAPARHQGFPRSGVAGLDGHRRLRPRRGSLAAKMGGSLCRLRGGREARLAAGDGAPDFPGRRLGRARRLRRHGPRQLGAALSCQLGHRPRRASSRSSGAHASTPRAGASPSGSVTASMRST